MRLKALRAVVDPLTSKALTNHAGRVRALALTTTDKPLPLLFCEVTKIQAHSAGKLNVAMQFIVFVLRDNLSNRANIKTESAGLTARNCDNLRAGLKAVEFRGIHWLKNLRAFFVPKSTSDFR